MPAVQRVNLLPNPSGETDTVGWVAGDANTTIGRSATGAHKGSWALTATAIGASYTRLQSSTFIPLDRAKDYGVLAHLASSSAPGRSVTINVLQYDAASAFVGALNVVNSTALVAVGTGGADLAGIVPANSPGWVSTATKFKIQAITDAGTPAGHVLYADAMLVSEMPAGSSYPAYFDGTSEFARWTGTAHASTSELLQANYYPYVLPRRRIRVTATHATIAYPLFTGFVEQWPLAFPGGGDYSEVAVTAIDAWAILGRQELTTAYREEVLADSPIAFYPLNDEDDTETLSNIAETIQPQPFFYNSKYGAGTWEFGAGAISIYEPSSSVNITPKQPTTFPRGGTLVDLNGGALVTHGSGAFSVEFWIKVSTTAITDGRNIFTQRGSNYTGAGTPTWEDLVCRYDDVTDAIDWKITTNGGGAIHAYSSAIDDDQWHHIVMTENGSSLKVYTDGVQTDSVTCFVNGTDLDGHAHCWLAGPDTDIGYSEWFDGRLSNVAVYDTALSGARVLAHYQAGAVKTWAEESETARIGRALDWASWPVADRDLSVAGLSTLQRPEFNGATALAVIQDAARSAGGVAFVNGSGQVTLQNRKHRLNAASSATFAESTGRAVEGDLEFSLDDTFVRNDITATRPRGAAARAYDQTSVDEYGRATDEFELAVTTDAECLTAAQWRLINYKNAAVRCPTVTLNPFAVDALWADALGLEIGDVITLAGLPATAPASSMDVVIESVNHVMTKGESWKTSFSLGPVPLAGWQLGVAGRSELGTTTRLTYYLPVTLDRRP